jgi:hypothetical protein
MIIGPAGDGGTYEADGAKDIRRARRGLISRDAR